MMSKVFKRLRDEIFTYWIGSILSTATDISQLMVLTRTPRTRQ